VVPAPFLLGDGLHLRFIFLFLFTFILDLDALFFSGFFIVRVLLLFLSLRLLSVFIFVKLVFFLDFNSFLLDLSLLRDFLLDILAHVKADGVINKFRVSFDKVLDLVLLNILESIILEVESDSSSTAEGVTSGVLGDGELTISSGSPNVLLVIVVLTGDLDSVGHQVRGVETNTELTDHRHVLVSLTHGF
jgi:hypothetical protein